MAEPDDHAPGAPEGAAVPNEFRVIVGWSHALFSHGLQLKLQARRAEGRQAGAVEDHRYLMTRNQALILANYLLDATGQTLPRRVRDGWLRRALRRLTGG